MDAKLNHSDLSALFAQKANISGMSTWSFIRDCKGEMTTVNPWTLCPDMSAGS